MAVGREERACGIEASRRRARDRAAVDERARGIRRAVDAVSARREEDQRFSGEGDGGRERELLAATASATADGADRRLAARDQGDGPVAGRRREARGEGAARVGRVAASAAAASTASRLPPTTTVRVRSSSGSPGFTVSGIAPATPRRR